MERQNRRDSCQVADEGKKGDGAVGMPVGQNNGSSTRATIQLSKKTIERVQTEPHGQKALRIYQHIQNQQYSEAFQKAVELFDTLAGEYTLIATARGGPKRSRRFQGTLLQ